MKKNTIFTGSAVAIVTPMHPDGSVNFEKFGELIDFQIENGTDAIVVCGTTGESATLTHEEHTECIRITVAHAAGRVPVIAGTGSNDTAYSVKLSLEAQRLGADALLLISPYYNKTTQKGLIAHFSAVAQAVDLPCILYNVPSRTGVNIAPATCKALSELENIVAVKEASGNISQVAQIAALCGDALDIYSGNDDQIVPLLSLGGKGVISVLANILPRETHAIVADYLAGRQEESRREQLRLLALSEALFCEVNPIPVKEAMNLLGMQAGPCRLPLVPMEESNRDRLQKELAALGML